jgi:hypothetical protein
MQSGCIAVPAHLLDISDFDRTVNSAPDTAPQPRKPARVYTFPSARPPAKHAKTDAYRRSLLAVLGMELLGVLLIVALFALWHVVRH